MTPPSKLAVEIEADFLNVAMLDMSEEVRLRGTLAALIDAKLAPLVEDGARLDWMIRTQAIVSSSQRLKTRKPLPWTKDDLENGFTICWNAENGDEISTTADTQEPTPRAAIDHARAQRPAQEGSDKP